MTKRIFLDIETSGLPRFKGGAFPDPKDLEAYANSRIVQLSFIVVHDKTILEEWDFLIRPVGFSITNSKIHGITQERALKDGYPIKAALEVLLQKMRQNDLVVCHNKEFDLCIFNSEIHRAGLNIDGGAERNKSYCTMKKNTRPGCAWPKLTDLYKRLFKEDFLGAHNALMDARSTMRVYFLLEEKHDMKDEIELTKTFEPIRLPELEAALASA